MYQDSSRSLAAQITTRGSRIRVPHHRKCSRSGITIPFDIDIKWRGNNDSLRASFQQEQAFQKRAATAQKELIPALFNHFGNHDCDGAIGIMFGGPTDKIQ